MLDFGDAYFKETIRMTHLLRTKTAMALGCSLCLVSSLALAAIDQVRVVNNTPIPVDIHVGGYATSQPIAPGQWKVFSYPFKIIPPGDSTPVQTSLLVATAAGQWQTTPNGLTSLNKPSMLLCIDYNSGDLANTTGNRKWTIKATGGFDQGCVVKPYKQPWYQGA